MGLLDELKDQAERIRSEGERQTEGARREAFYQSQLRPKMLHAFDYLNELLQQLNVVQPEVVAEFRVPGYAHPISAVQVLPRLTVDSSDNIKRLSLHMRYVATDLEFSVTPPTQADETRNFLLSGRFPFSDWPIRETNGEPIGLRFSISELAIPAQVTIYADIEHGCLLFYSKNMDGFHDHRDVVRPEDVDADWLDRLGRFLLGQGHSPAHLELPVESRAAIRRAIESENIQRKRELAATDRILQERLESERVGSRVKQLFSSIKSRLSNRPG